MAPAIEPLADVMAHIASGSLGEYSISKDIGEGTFGKVKRKSGRWYFLLPCSFLLSCGPHFDAGQGRSQVHL